MTAIQTAKDLKILSLDQLLGSLITHKMMLGNQSKKKKGIAIKATAETEKKNEDEDRALLTKTFKRFLNKKPFKEK